MVNREHDLRTAPNGTVSCARCGLVLTANEVSGELAPRPCHKPGTDCAWSPCPECGHVIVLERCTFIAPLALTGLPDNRCIGPAGHSGAHVHEIPRIRSEPSATPRRLH